MPLFKINNLILVPPLGIEPRSRDPQSRVLSIKLWGQKKQCFSVITLTKLLK